MTKTILNESDELPGAQLRQDAYILREHAGRLRMPGDLGTLKLREHAARKYEWIAFKLEIVARCETTMSNIIDLMHGRRTHDAWEGVRQSSVRHKTPNP